MTVTDPDVIHNDEKMNLEINSCIKNMPSKKHFQALNRNFVIKSAYQTLWSEKIFHKKTPILQGSANLILRLSWIRQQK